MITARKAARAFALGPALILAVGCAAHGGYRAKAPDLQTHCYDSIQAIQPLPLAFPQEGSRVETVEFADVARCHRSATGDPVAVALYSLAGVDPPAEVRVAVELSTGGTFASAVEVLDADWQPLQRRSFSDFTRRGTQYTLDVFLNASSPAPAYLLLTPDLTQVGGSDAVVGSFASPLVIPAGPVMFVYTAGKETRTVRPFMTGGKLRVVPKRPQSSVTEPK